MTWIQIIADFFASILRAVKAQRAATASVDVIEADKLVANADKVSLKLKALSQ